MSFNGQAGISCDHCTKTPDNYVEHPWNSLAADDGNNYYFCGVGCLADWATETSFIRDYGDGS